MVALILLAAQLGFPGEISERLATPPSFVIESTRPPGDIEFCVADVMSAIGEVAAFQDGSERIVTASRGAKVVGAARLGPVGAGSRVTFHIVGRGFDDRMKSRIAARCV